MNVFWLFVILNVVNVVIQTVKSIATIKCGKFVASAINAIAYGLYTVVLVYMNCEIPLWEKVVVVGGANFVGVFFVKMIEQKLRKDKLWKVEATVHLNSNFMELHRDLQNAEIPHNFVDAGKYVLFNCYCATQSDSVKAKEILQKYNAKYFATESKML